MSVLTFGAVYTAEKRLTYLFFVAFVYGCHAGTEIERMAGRGPPKYLNYVQEANSPVAS